ncbi:MAG: hypothetical protein M3O31_00605 [Acidobacteriota bacterium]|nr:hypothetical protein [Acidobacteriota bacterium]
MFERNDGIRAPLNNKRSTRLLDIESGGALGDETFVWGEQWVIGSEPDGSMSALDMRKHSFRPVCTQAEIDRIFDPKDATDHLLALRGNYIVDHMRIFRYFLRRFRAQRAGYSLERNFPSHHYAAYLKTLPVADRQRLTAVAYGDVFTAEADGEIFNSPFGPIVTISRSIKYFLEYGGLALRRLHRHIPIDVRFRALIIALRVMFGHESMDFEVDPRGVLSKRLLFEIRDPIELQLQFIVGHEFAHYLLGHLSSDKVHASQLRFASHPSSSPELAKVYSVSQAEELAADLASITLPQVGDQKRAELLNATLIWFGLVELYQHASDVVCPKPSWKESHPSARDRHLHLLKNVETRYLSDLTMVSDSIVHFVELLKPVLSEYLSLHVDVFEHHGSIYLSDEPNSRWRGPKLVDRVDYY